MTFPIRLFLFSTPSGDMQEEPVREVNTAASRRDPFSILNGNSSEGTNGVRPQQNGHHTFKNGDKRVPGSPVNGSPARSTESTSTSSHAESLEMFAFPSFISKYDHYDPMDPINFRHAYPLQLVKGKRRIWRGIKNPGRWRERKFIALYLCSFVLFAQQHTFSARLRVLDVHYQQQ